jgi:long-chain fatty acid transport protein
MHYGVPLPSAFGQYKLNERFTAGLGVYAPFGLKTRYKKDSYVASEGVRSELEIIDIAPAAAYRLTEKLTLGGSVIVRYIHGRMTNTVTQYQAYGYGTGYSDFDLDGWTMAWTAGALYEFTPKTRIGLSYRSQSMQTVKGTHELSGFSNPALNRTDHNGKASPDLPQSVLLSAWHDVNDRWSVSSSVRWTDWEDSFQEFTLKSGLTEKTVDESWKKTWTLSLGTDYKLTDRWTIRFGTAWDQSPVRNRTHRTVRIPDSDRFWLSTGASYTVGNVQIDAGFAHLFMKNSTAVESAFNARYKSYSNMFGLQMQYRF